MHNLENHIELTRLARANEGLTWRFGTIYSLFLAEVDISVLSLDDERENLLTVEKAL